MTYVALFVFSTASILCGIAVAVALTRFVVQIHRDARSGDPQ